MTFTATSCSNAPSTRRARYTSAIPPDAIRSVTSYGSTHSALRSAAPAAGRRVTSSGSASGRTTERRSRGRSREARSVAAVAPLAGAGHPQGGMRGRAPGGAQLPLPGRQAGLPSNAPWLVTVYKSVPVASTITIAPSPPNAMNAPSGDHEGARSVVAEL